MKIKPLVIATMFAVLFTGCAGTSPTRLVGDTIGAAGGALLGKLRQLLASDGSLDFALEKLRELDVERTNLSDFEKKLVRDAQDCL